MAKKSFPSLKYFVFHERKSPCIRLFCFPYAGGGASIFGQWSDVFPEEIEIYAAQPPGRESRISEALIDNVHGLVQEFLPAMEQHLDIPFALLGYSTGALVAFEIVRELRRKGYSSPACLIVAAARAPHIPEPQPIHHLPDDEFIEGLKRFSGTPDAVLENKEIMNLYAPILRADLAIEERYNYVDDSPFDIPLSAFYGKEDKESGREVMGPWARYTAKSFSIHEIEGEHFFMRTSMESFLSTVSSLLLQYKS